jgi:anti-sigma regulatory factor (Ser/Thr protein kinase)
VLLLPVALTSLPFIGSRLHTYACDVAGQRGETKQVHDLRLAVQEACANLIKHGQMAPEERRLVVRFEFAEDVLSVLITDQGAPFEPPVVTELPGTREEPAEGGYGLFLIQALVDEMFYQRHARGNTLVLRKRLPSKEST